MIILETGGKKQKDAYQGNVKNVRIFNILSNVKIDKILNI